MEDTHRDQKQERNYGKYQIYLVGFPHVVEESQTDSIPVVDLIRNVVPEARVVVNNIRGDFASQLADADPASQSFVGPSEAGGREARVSASDSHEQPALEAPVRSSASHDLFSPTWIDNEALRLLDQIQQYPLAGELGHGGRVLLSGYGIGGVVVKQAIVLANMNPRYYDVALKVSRLVFFATPHRSTEHLSWAEIVLGMLEATGMNYRSRLAQDLPKLVDYFAQLAHVFYRSAAKYPTTNFIDSRDAGASTITKFTNDFEQVVSWADHDTTSHGLTRCRRDDLQKLKSLREHFAPRYILPGQDEGITKHMNAPSQERVDRIYFGALQSLSSSPWILGGETRTMDRPDEFKDILEVYHPLLCSHDLSLRNIRGHSVQVTGPVGCGRTALVKLISHMIRQESSTVIIENCKGSADWRPWSLYGVYVSFIFQVISQRPSLFWPVQSLMAQILCDEVWTTQALGALLSSIFVHSRNVDFLVLVYDFEAWPIEVQEWLCRIHTLIPDSSGSKCTLIASCLNTHSNLTSGTMHHLDLTSNSEQDYKKTLAEIKIRHLAEDSYRTGPLAENLGDEFKQQIVLAAQQFHGSLTSTSQALSYVFRMFTLNSSKPISLAIKKFPRTEEKLYQELARALVAKPGVVFLWGSSTLSWVLLAVRPLHVEELSVAVALKMNGCSISEMENFISTDMERDLRNHMSDLIVVENQRLRIVNSRAQEVLRSEDHLHLDTDYDLTLLCLNYLTIILGDEQSKAWEECQSSVSYRHPTREPHDRTLVFLSYACQFWPAHFLRVENPDEHLKKEVAGFLKRPRVADRWFTLHLLSTGVSSNPLATDCKGFGGQAVIPSTAEPGGSEKADLLSPERTGTAEASPATSHALGLAAMMAGYVGLTSIAADLLDEAQLHCKLEVVHVKRGLLERDISISKEAFGFYTACAISNGDDRPIRHLMLEHRERMAGCFPLHRAVLSGCFEMVQMLFKELGDPMGANASGQTPLHMAAICGSMKVARFLVSESSAVGQTKTEGRERAIDARDKDSQTPSLLATRMGHVGVARYFAGSGADLRVRDRTGKTALHYAVLYCPQIVQDILEKDEETAYVQDNDSRTPLHVAARSGPFETTSIILASAKRSGRLLEIVNAGDAKNKTPLHYAARNGHTEVARILMVEGANTDSTEDTYPKPQTPAELAAKYGHLSTLTAILSPPERMADRDRLLVEASRAGQLLIVQYLLQQEKVSPDGHDEQADEAPLLVATSKSHSEVVLTLLHSGANINQDDSERKTALHYAAKNGFSEIVRLLLDHPPESDRAVNVNAPDSLRYTPLHYAAMSFHVDIVEMFLDKGAYIGALSRQEETPLHLGVRSAEVVRLLLERGAEANSSDFLGQTPLHMAMREESLESVRLLISRGANIDACDDDGRTPIYYPISQNNLAVVKWLLLGDADDPSYDRWPSPGLAVESSALDEPTPSMPKSHEAPRMEKPGKPSLLNWAAELSSVDVLAFLLDAGFDIQHQGLSGRTPLHDAILGRKLENMHELIERGAAVDFPDDEGETPLLTAAKQSSDEAVSILLQAGASINKTDSMRRTALYLASYYGSVEVVTVLLREGADVGLCNEDGWSPLHAAADNIEIARLLVEKGADVDLQKDDQWTPLHLAANWDRSAVVSFLLERADPNLVNDEGRTALHVALNYASDETTKALLDHSGRNSVDLSKPDSAGISPIHLAARHCSSEVVEKLIGKVADFNVKTPDGATCLDIAVEMDRTEILEVLVGRDAPSGPGPGWSLEDMVTAYWKAIEEGRTESVAVLVKKESGLLHQLSEEGLNGLEVCLSNYSLEEEDEALPLLFLKLGVDPFQRRLGDQRSGFELGFESREVIKTGFLNACLEYIPDSLEGSALGFRELRAATEMDTTELWRNLEPLMPGSQGETDQDGWNIHHFLHQAVPRVAFADFNKKGLSKTKTPKGLIWPRTWQSASIECNISADGLTVLFEASQGTICLRADHPLPPRKLGLPYFEMTVGGAELDEPEDPASVFAIGLSGEFCNQSQAFLGWHVWSVGYHSDDGGVHEQSPSKDELAPVYGPNDTVGCGVDYDTGTCIFTLNGDIIYQRSVNLIYRKLYPCVTHQARAGNVKVNFGDAPFVWAGAARLYQTPKKPQGLGRT